MKLLKPISILLFLVLAGVGCISFKGGKGGNDGGVWKSGDRGEHWEQRVAFPTANAVGSVAGVSVLGLTIDPQDHLALYARTSDDGLLYTYDGAATWQQARQLASGNVTSVVVDPKDKCTIYVTLGPRLYKSTDCSRSFADVYFESRGQVMTQVAIDWFNPNIIYLGSASGDLLKSTDAGTSWTVITRFNNKIQRIFLAPHDSRTVYVGTWNAGIWKSADGGENWTDLRPAMGEFGAGANLQEIVSDKVTRELLLVASAYGILRSHDGGATWEALNLPTPPGSIVVYSLAVNPNNGSEIYYGTASTFYRSVNGGEKWITDRLPTSRTATALAVDPADPNTVYMGVTKFKK